MRKKGRLMGKPFTKRERAMLGIIDDVLWMAIRYSNGRHTYAPGMVRSAITKLKQVNPGFELRRDITITGPTKAELRRQMCIRSDWLDDLFKEK